MKKPAMIFFAVVLLLAISSCNTQQPQQQEQNSREEVAELGKTVVFDYAAGFQNGTLFDTSIEQAAREAGIHNPDRTYQPVRITLGKQPLLEGVQEALIGMKEGETANVRIPPEKAYGNLKEDAVTSLPKGEISNAEGLRVGDPITIRTKQGRDIQTFVTEIGEENVTVTANHPYAGKTILFSIVLRQIE